MKRFVDGVERDLPDSDAAVVAGPDRLYVRTNDGTQTAVSIRSGDATLLSYKGRQHKIERTQARGRAAGGAASGEIHAPMPGLIIDVLVEAGQEVKKGERLVVLEAMKTQQPFAAPYDGTVAKLMVAKGDQVVADALLVSVTPVEQL